MKEVDKMEDKEYYKKMVELFEEDILVDLFEQGYIGMFDDIEYELEETIENIRDGKDMNSSVVCEGSTKIIIDLYRETYNRL